MNADLAILLNAVSGCRVCALPHGARPVVQIGSAARLVIVGQAPGLRVHTSGVPWDDDSGKRLRDWIGLEDRTFYDAEQVGLLPMGFCYPGTGDGADLPPRPECAPLWHDRLLARMPERRLILLVGIHAQGRYLAKTRAKTLTETVRAFRTHLPAYFPLPHPSWRSTGWMRRNPWFEADTLPALRDVVAAALA